VSAIYGIIAGSLIFCVYQLVIFQTEGPWLEAIGALVTVLMLLTAGLFAMNGWRRYREGLRGQGAGWGIGTVLFLGLAGLAAYIAVTAAQVGPYISGADVHLTRPVLGGLPRPPGAKLTAERPGPADTESISDEFTTPHLEQVQPFYESNLKRLGWVEDAQSETGLLRFERGQFVVTVLVITAGQPHGAGDYAVTVDRNTSPAASGSSSPSG
jgi:hypothetical protein